MVTRLSASQRMPGGDRKERKVNFSRQQGDTSIPEGLSEIIEIERDNLSKADSVLGCLVTSMEYGTESTDQPYYPDVAQLARELIRKSINGLDSLVLQRRLLRNKVKETGGLVCYERAYAEIHAIH
jgi:hypothetical protein